MFMSSESRNFQREVPYADIQTDPRTWPVCASREDMDALAPRVSDVLRIDKLQGDVTLGRKGSDICVSGKVAAEVTRRCTISLAPMLETIAESFQFRLTREFSEEDALSDEDIDLLEGDEIGLGEVLIQQMCLALTPHPQIAGATVDPDHLNDAPRDNPFAELKGLLKEQPGKDE